VNYISNFCLLRQNGYSPTLFVLQTRERLSGDGFEIAGVLTNQPAARFGLTPRQFRPAVIEYQKVFPNIPSRPTVNNLKNI
jgi:hypothetical protein